MLALPFLLPFLFRHRFFSSPSFVLLFAISGTLFVVLLASGEQADLSHNITNGL